MSGYNQNLREDLIKQRKDFIKNLASQFKKNIAIDEKRREGKKRSFIISSLIEEPVKIGPSSLREGKVALDGFGSILIFEAGN